MNLPIIAEAFALDGITDVSVQRAVMIRKSENDPTGRTILHHHLFSAFCEGHEHSCETFIDGVKVSSV